jgi:hypothetical protein
MPFRLSILASGTFVFGTTGAIAAEPPISEVSGFPINPHLLEVVGSANAVPAGSELRTMEADALLSADQLAALARDRPPEPLPKAGGPGPGAGDQE